MGVLGLPLELVDAIHEAEAEFLAEFTAEFAASYQHRYTDFFEEVDFSIYQDFSEVTTDFTVYQNDPAGFAEQVLGVKFSFDPVREARWLPQADNLAHMLPSWAAAAIIPAAHRTAQVQWTVQQDILLCIRDNRKTTVRACFSVGKTFIAAIAVCWKTYCFRPCLVVVSGPTERQLEDNLWKEIDELRENALVRLPGKSRKLKLSLNTSQLALGFVAKSAGSSAGYHAKANVFLVLDECSEISDAAHGGFHGLGADDDYRELDIGNPVSTTGWFKNSHCDEDEARFYCRVAINALWTPNVLSGRRIVPGIVRRDWVDWARRTFLDRGLLAMWHRKVLGEFYEFSGDLIIPSDWVALAIKRWADDSIPDDGPCSLGVDVAGAGRDSTVVSIKRGRRLWIESSWQIESPDEQAQLIADIQQTSRASRICVDKTGQGGAVYWALKRLVDAGGCHGMPELVPVTFNSAPSPDVRRRDGEKSTKDDCEMFSHILDQMLFAMRDAFDPSNPLAIALHPKDTQLHRELPMRTWGLEGTNEQKVKVERKRDMRRRISGYKSPDHEESALMHWAPGQPQLWWSGKGKSAEQKAPRKKKTAFVL